MSYPVDAGGRYSFPMTEADRVRVVADCSCGWAMDGPERVFSHLSGSHATAHNKGTGGLPAAGGMTVQRFDAEHEAGS